MGTALPIEVREELDRMPAVTSPTAYAWSHGMARSGLSVCTDMLEGRHGSAREKAVLLAAASIRLVEYLNQDWP